MIVNRGETKSIKVSNGTIDGILFNVYMYAAANNTTLTVADLNPQEISVKAELTRSKRVIQICNDNLKVLGLFSAKNYGLTDWAVGHTLTPHGVSTKEDMIALCFLSFGGCVNAKDDDELVIQAVCGRGTFGAALDQAVSYVEFNERIAIGIERGTPQIIAQVVQANITNEKYSFGDGVGRLTFLNFDQTGIATQVINTLQLASDKLQASVNFYDIFNMDKNVFTSPVIQYSAAGQQLSLYPQTFTLYAWHGGRMDVLDNVFVNASYNSANVNASQNYLVAQKFLFTPELTARAAALTAKHLEANHSKAGGEA